MEHAFLQLRCCDEEERQAQHADSMLLDVHYEVFRFERGEELSGITRSQLGIDIKVTSQAFDDGIDSLAIVDQFPNPAAAFVQLEVNPVFNMKQEGLVADGSRHDLR